MWNISIFTIFLIAFNVNFVVNATTAVSTLAASTTSKFSEIAFLNSTQKSLLLDYTTKAEIIVSLVDKSPQIVYCGGFRNSEDFKTNNDVFKQNFFAYSVNNSATVLISNLIPITTYKIYCLTVSVQDSTVMMPYSVAVTKSLAITTQCCKFATFDIALSSLYTNTATAVFYPNAITLMLSHAPSTTVIFTLTVQSTTTQSTTQSVVGSLQPSVVIVPSTYVPYTPISIVYTSGVPDTYRIVVAVSGTAGSEYTLITSGSSTIKVLSTNAEPAAPIMQSAVFSNDGTYFTVYFDSSTNQPVNIFCNSIFAFNGVGSSTCVWDENRSSLRIYPTSDLTVGNSIALKAFKIQAYCTDLVTKCQNWSKYSSATTVILLAPFAAGLTLPTVSISAPNTIGTCTSLTLDMTASLGAAGRPWLSAKLTVSDVAIGANTTSLSKYLNNNIDKSFPVVTIPTSYL